VFCRCTEEHSRDTSTSLGNTPTCQNHGYCDPDSPKCQCYKGFHGIDCGIRDCPWGPAWFDEPKGISIHTF
jgi:hypothetical protein